MSEEVLLNNGVCSVFCKGPSGKYDQFIRVSMDKNEENEKGDIDL